MTNPQNRRIPHTMSANIQGLHPPLPQDIIA